MLKTVSKISHFDALLPTGVCEEKKHTLLNPTKGTWEYNAYIVVINKLFWKDRILVIQLKHYQTKSQVFPVLVSLFPCLLITIQETESMQIFRGYADNITAMTASFTATTTNNNNNSDGCS